MTDDATLELEDQIELLKQLDKIRIESGRLRNEGIHALPDMFKENLQNLENKEPKDIDSILYLVRALYKDSEHLPDYSENSRKIFINYCEDLDLYTIENHDIPVWYAANLLHTLVSIPGGAHLKATFYCYYWIIRELYTADSAEWSIGGARASKDGQVTAYMTSECVNALLALGDAHKDTGAYIATIGAFLERQKQLDALEKQNIEFKDTPLTKWIETERERSTRSCDMYLKRYSKHLTLSLDNLSLDDLLDKVGLKNRKYFREYLKNSIIHCRDNIREVLVKIYEYRDCIDKETSLTSDLINCRTHLCNPEDIDIDQNKISVNSDLFRTVTRSHQGHHIAMRAIVDALDKALKGLNKLSGDDETDFNEISDIFTTISVQIHNILIPAQNFLSTVLDHELATDTELHYGQPEELIWAAFSYGKLSKTWDKDHRLLLASQRLINTISDHGIFPNRYHFHFLQEKGTWQTEASCVLNAFAQLLKHVHNVNIDIDITKKLLRFFEEKSEIKKSNKNLMGWRKDITPVHSKSDPNATAQAILALDEINGMLDDRINHLILKHFSVKWPDRELQDIQKLNKLFYPDYGMLLISENIQIKDLCQGEEEPKIERNESIAVTLLRMQSHVNKTLLKNEETCNSLILYGPAGTGKTYLIESLAKTCDVPLIEVTPSDIVKQGIDNVERRARAVFEALSLLTRVVILFDEFDPVLKRRDPDNQNPSVFSFLTPGMLPKLKTLHDKAEKRSVAYVLITNLIGSLDEAAIRQGRFDEKIGIFPPDLLARTGRFLDQYYIYKNEAIPDKHWNPMVKIIKKTKEKGMTTIGNPSWFTALIDNIEDNDKITDILDSLESEDEFKGEIKGEGKIAEKEYYEWAWITKCDETVEENGETWASLRKALESPTKVDPPRKKSLYYP